MTRLQSILVAGVLLAATPLAAQEARRRVPSDASSGDSSGGQAVARGDGSRGNSRPERGEAAPPPAPAPQPQAAARAPQPAESAPAAAAAPERTARVRVPPRETAAADAVVSAPVAINAGDADAAQRRQGSNPSTGRAVPRPGPAPGERPVRTYGGSGGGGHYNHSYYYPRRYYPYGYGAFGLGYFYYDPFAWSTPGFYASFGYGYPYGYGYGYGYPYGYYPGPGYGGGSGYYDIGSLKIDVKGPKEAEVLVDGYYAGSLDDFDGTFQSLDLASGPYKIEVRAPGYEPLEFDIRILAGRKITYRGALHRLP